MNLRAITPAFLVSLCIAAITTFCVALLGGGGNGLLWIVFFSAVVVATLVGYFFLERFVYRPLAGLEDRVHAHRRSLTALSDRAVAVIDEREREIERLKRLEATRQDLIANVSHELKTPIFAAQGFVHTLLDGAAKEKGVRKKFLKKAARSLDGLDMLVQDLLTLSQMESGQIKMRFGVFDLYALTAEVFDQFRSKVDKRGITLRIEGPHRKVRAYGDEARIGQVMANLIANAIKHSDEGGEVIVRFEGTNRTVRVSVQDFGEGVPPEHINRIFERFYRVDKSRSREKGGTGLGLAIVKHILEGHQTIAEVESEPGKGSTFSFRLNREKQEEDGVTATGTSEA